MVLGSTSLPFGVGRKNTSRIREIHTLERTNMSLTDEIIAKADSLDAVCAGMVPLADVLNGPSHRSLPTDDDPNGVGRPSGGSLLVLGLLHPESDPRLDWWERGDSWGNRRLREISEVLRQWLADVHGLTAQPLPYRLEKGGIYLKDAAVLSGLGIIGESNLLLHPQWGPRIRLRSIHIEADLPPTGALEGFAPCEACEKYCQQACPVAAFPAETYSRSNCYRQMDSDVADKVAEGEVDPSGRRAWVIKYCRDCEQSCPVGA
jgi:epoxyqueuosine reductase